MQTRGLHRSIHKGYHVLRSIELSDTTAQKKEKALKDWETLRSKGVPIKIREKIIGISKATYHRKAKRYKDLGTKGLLKRSCRPKSFRQSTIPKDLVQSILDIRRAHPTFGKAKIAAILRRSNITLSESSVGRVLAKAIKDGVIRKHAGAKTRHKKRQFTSHAQPYVHGMPTGPGQSIQIDHLVAHVHGAQYRHFQAICPVSRMLVSEIYTTASSSSAAMFLEKVKRSLPFPVRSIQVDGGSEFRKHFEEKCANDGIPLFVLPPASPKLNGKVERVNRTMREDFYRADRQFVSGDIVLDRKLLEEKVRCYNTFRPHHALGMKTPEEYVNILANKETSLESHSL